MSFSLHFESIVADGASPSRMAFVLHGIFGSGRNWRSFARGLVSEQPDWRLVLVDQRGHGQSVGAPPPHDLSSCASDLAQLSHELGAAPTVVVAHSFGGKVALRYAQDHGEGLSRLFLLDSPLAAVPSKEVISTTEAGRILEVMRSMPLPAERRTDVTKVLIGRGFDPAVSRWMATNLRASDGGYVWAFDLDVMEALLDDYWRLDGYAVIDQLPPELSVFMIVAEESDRWSIEEKERLKGLAGRGVIGLEVLPHAGHWLHVDNAKGLRSLMPLG